MFQCDKCEKRFALKWRLTKHMTLHTEKNVKHCHYFNNGEKCRFEQFGCKFLHSVSKNCINNWTCKRKLCPYRHSEEERNDKNDKNSTKVDDLADK